MIAKQSKHRYDTDSRNDQHDNRTNVSPITKEAIPYIPAFPYPDDKVCDTCPNN
jgi:hypothetical protein